jgi:hypothetical protein
MIKCKQCEYFSYDSMGYSAYGYGKCWRYAPQPGLNQDVVRPRVLDTDMCGDAVKAEEEHRQLNAQEMAELASRVVHPEPPKKINALVDEKKAEKLKKSQSPPEVAGDGEANKKW